jgi:hypothetical protein
MKKLTSILVLVAAAMLLGVAYAGNSLGSGYAVTSDWHGKDVPPGTLVTVTAMTTDDTITQVTFLWKSPSGNTVFTDVDNTRETDGQIEGKDIFIFSSAQTPKTAGYSFETGDWGVQAMFQGPDGKTKEGVEEVVSIKATSFFVVPDIPVIGTLGATGAALLALVVFKARKKRLK